MNGFFLHSCSLLGDILSKVLPNCAILSLIASVVFAVACLLQFYFLILH